MRIIFVFLSESNLYLLKGEKKEDGLRELAEELGVMIDLDSTKYLGYRVEIININEHRDKEFQHVYLVNNDTLLTEFHLCLDEVNALVELDLKDAYKLFWHKSQSIWLNGILREICISLYNSEG